MTPFVRGEEPAILGRHRHKSADFVQRRKENPSAAFSWPEENRESILPHVRAALEVLTQSHCSYCDAFPIDVTGKKEVDHFKPKSLFPQFVLDWPNLYVACTACNDAKLAIWNELILRPDEPGYAFNRYFKVDALTGELQPNPIASTADRDRALETIRVLGLQRGGLCIDRRKHIAQSLSSQADPTRPYRFL